LSIAPECQTFAASTTKLTTPVNRNIKIAVGLMRAANLAAEEIRLPNKRLGTGPFRDGSSHSLDIHDSFPYQSERFRR
jgi:hypothetical protein